MRGQLKRVIHRLKDPSLTSTNTPPSPVTDCLKINLFNEGADKLKLLPAHRHPPGCVFNEQSIMAVV